MGKQLTVIKGNKAGNQYHIPEPEEKLKHYRNVMGVVLQDAQDAWSSVWDELKEGVTDGTVIVPAAEKGFKPKCGWPEFLENVWLIKHYLDYAQRFSKGDVSSEAINSESVMQ